MSKFRHNVLMRRTTPLRAGLFLALVACSPSLTVPDGALVTCRTDADCPGGESCVQAAGYCVLPALLDEGPPTPLSPVSGSVMLASADKRYTLAWTPRVAARTYFIQVATDEEFTALVLESTATAPILEVTLTGAVTYWWRVRADTSSRGFDIGAAKAFFDTVDPSFLRVTAAATADDGVVPVGNVAKPFHRVQSAIAAASTLGVHEVRVAEGVFDSVAVTSGVSLTGGWSSDFSERDPLKHPSIIDGASASGIIEPTLVDGFQVSVIPYLQDFVVAFRVTASTDALTLSNNVIETRAVTATTTAHTSSVALSIIGGLTDTTGPLVIGNTIRAGNTSGAGDQRSYGIDVGAGAPTIVENSITAGAALTYTDGNCLAFAIAVHDKGLPLIARNTLIGGRATCNSGQSAAIDIATGASPTIIANVMLMPPSNYVRGVVVENDVHSAKARIVGNSILLNGLGPVYGLMLDGPAEVSDNIIAVTSAGANVGIVQIEQGRPPHVLTNNLLAGFPTPYNYYPGTAYPVALTLAAAENFIAHQYPTPSTATGVASGNIEISSAASVGFSAVASDTTSSDLHLTASAPASTASGGIIYIPTECGAVPDAPACDAVGLDFANAPRTCAVPATSCWSRGAYERDP